MSFLLLLVIPSVREVTRGGPRFRCVFLSIRVRPIFAQTAIPCNRNTARNRDGAGWACLGKFSASR